MTVSGRLFVFFGIFGKFWLFVDKNEGGKDLGCSKNLGILPEIKRPDFSIQKDYINMPSVYRL